MHNYEALKTTLNKFKDDYALDEPTEWYLIQRLSTNISVLRNRLGSNYWTVLEHEEADSMFSRLAFAGDVLTDEMKQFIGWCKLPWNEVLNCMKKDEQVEQVEEVEEHEEHEEPEQFEESDESVDEETEADEPEEVGESMEVDEEVEHGGGVKIDEKFVWEFYKRDVASPHTASGKLSEKSKNHYRDVWRNKLIKLLERNELIGENWNDIVDALNDIKNDYMAEKKFQKTQEPTEYANVPAIAWSTILEKVETFSKTIHEDVNASIDDIRTAILTRLYVCDHPPRRVLDYSFLRLRNFVPALLDNYYLDDGTVVLNHYKTAVLYGQYKFKVTDVTKALIERVGSDHLFFDAIESDCNYYRPPDFTQMFHKFR